ncbi:MAG TPA: group III truncated hemoglobin [Caulobacteraceae bacterium]|nr:group III truncated hemoglobin [Caulobacteraceae bacterium]
MRRLAVASGSTGAHIFDAMPQIPQRTTSLSATRPGPGVAAGVDEALIETVVHAFYSRVRRDPELGPIFEAAIGGRWDAHLAKLCDFWSSVLLGTGRFDGSPMAAHARRPEIGAPHFDRWLALFEQTVTALCAPPAAAVFIERARMIGRSLLMGMAAGRGELPAAR